MAYVTRIINILWGSLLLSIVAKFS